MPSLHDEKVEQRKPHWLKIKLHNDPRYADVAALVRQHDLHTICSSGRCPNISECWGRGVATFMIGGDICTRSCRFCATRSGRPFPLDHNEPVKIARSIRIMGLRHAVVTSVDRDDLPDGGAAHWAATVRAIRELNPATTIELLIPDFDGLTPQLDTVLEAGAEITGHNIETVERLTPQIRSRAEYSRSLNVLKHIADSGLSEAKSGLMVGLGETQAEVLHTLDDLAAAGVQRITIGQYLQPTAKHWPVEKYVTPEQFERYRTAALERGITHTESAPMVRSSYMADQAALPELNKR